MAAPHHCETCTCGLIRYEYSDRVGHYDPEDPESIWRSVKAWALDGADDRGWCLPFHGKLNAGLHSVVDKHLSSINPKWEDQSVSMTLEQENEFHAAIVAVLTRPSFNLIGLPITAIERYHNGGDCIFFGQVVFTQDFGPWKEGQKVYQLTVDTKNGHLEAANWDGGNPLLPAGKMLFKICPSDHQNDGAT